eukprot:638934-Pyramimonas_sp.AAC.1
MARTRARRQLNASIRRSRLWALFDRRCPCRVSGHLRGAQLSRRPPPLYNFWLAAGGQPLRRDKSICCAGRFASLLWRCCSF